MNDEDLPPSYRLCGWKGILRHPARPDHQPLAPYRSARLADRGGEAVAHIIADTTIRDSSLTVETTADLERLLSGQGA